MSPATLTTGADQAAPHQRRRAVLIVISCTLIVAVAQYLIKLGANQLTHAGLLATTIGIFTIPPLFAGYALYGLFTVLFVYALRHGELSILYPLIALGYVWVTITAVVAFHESITPLKIIGIATIIAGVAVLGASGSGK